MGFARGSIDADAEKVVRKLSRNGHEAYLVGGCVRDLLLGRTPKDFDVATSATPSEIRSLFRNCRIIGRRFRLAHIIFGRKIIETSTFRANPSPNRGEDGLLIRRDNVFGSATEDAYRRDFTINGLFYNVETREVIDYVGGLEDLEAGLVRTIGEPAIRLREDPVRMMRAIKFAARLGFQIETSTFQAMVAHRTDIEKCAPPRVLEEFYRLLRGGAARRSVELLRETGIDEVLSPRLAALYGPSDDPVRELDDDDEEASWRAVWADEYESADEEDALELSFATPDEIAQARSIAWNMLEWLDRYTRTAPEPSSPLLLACVVNPFLLARIEDPEVRAPELEAMFEELIQPLLDSLRVPRREGERMRQILRVQRRLGTARRRSKKAPSAARRELLADARLVDELTRAARGESDAMAALSKKRTSGFTAAPHNGAGADDDTDSSRARRKRRRGGRRRRRAPGDDASIGDGA